MAVKASHIRITPLYGGRSETGVCTLLEVGGSRILLDCGASLLTASPEETAYVQKLTNDLVSAGGVDAIVLSHADLHHIGALPVIAGCKGLQNTPVICSLPVGKLSQLTLYDYLGNLMLEGENIELPYTHDDIDHAFSNLVTLQYSQLINLSETRETRQQTISLCALPSGRTLGGAIWRIRCGPAEILYAMDVNLRKEVMLDGANMELLSTSPTLLISEAACASRANSTIGKKKKDKDDMAQLLAQVMSTLRAGGNVLIPCECSARIQEILLAFAKYWADNKLGMYHLVFLSQMSRNIVESTRMQLEWMSDTLTRPFYNGKPNPLELSTVKFITDVRTIERKLHGPKVVFATDASMSHGLSKELLLRWGGDPRCKVIFTEASDPASLAAQLRTLALTPPIILSLQRPVKENLVGQDLINYRAEQERKRKAEEELRQRKRRQAELSQFTANAHQEDIQEEGDEEDAKELQLRKKKKSGVWQHLEPNLMLFERKQDLLTMDEYGLSTDDLQFQDILPAETRMLTAKDRGASARGPAAAPAGAEVERTREQAPAPNEMDIAPYKIKSVTQRVQFTCEFVEAQIGTGRMDLKAFKALIAKTNPARLFVVRGSDKDCDTILQYAKASGIEAYAPRNRRSATISVHTERLRMQLPHTLLPRQYAKLQKGPTSSVSALATAVAAGTAVTGQTTGECSIYVLKGSAIAMGADVSGQEGTKLIKYQGATAGASGAASAHQVVDEEAEQLDISGADAAQAADGAPDVEAQSRIEVPEEAQGSIGVVSLGEVTLNQLKQQLENQGMKVEFMIGAQGGVLICNEQVVVRKENDDLFIEGPPIKAFYDARKVVYQQYAFL